LEVALLLPKDKGQTAAAVSGLFQLWREWDDPAVNGNLKLKTQAFRHASKKRDFFRRKGLSCRDY
jgi:hypothetical protein